MPNVQVRMKASQVSREVIPALKKAASHRMRPEAINRMVSELEAAAFFIDSDGFILVSGEVLRSAYTGFAP